MDVAGAFARPATWGLLLLALGWVFDLYWDAGQLLYVQDPCVWDSDRDQLFLQARPAANAVFPETFPARQDLTGQVRRLGEACGLIWRRPPLAIAALRIGQQGRADWVADLSPGRDGRHRLHGLPG